MSNSYLERILARKRREIARRLRHQGGDSVRPSATSLARNRDLSVALRRPQGAPPRVIAELKIASPSAGLIRPWQPGMLPSLARDYERAGAAAVSVLTDFPGFRSCPLDARRVASAVRVPVLFKEFVIHEVQLALASAVGAAYVLLLVRALSDVELQRLIDATRAWGMEPIVEAADAAELERAIGMSATIIGINARDLHNFTLDSDAAADLIARIPSDRISIYMSGIRSAEDFSRISASSTHAVLIGEGLMQHSDPGATLAMWLSHA